MQCRSWFTQVSILAVAASFVLSPRPSIAAGYGLREFSASAMGAAHAGVAATGTDASYQVYNPSSIAAVEQTDFSVAAIGIFPTSSASYPVSLTSAGTPAGGPATADEFIHDAFVPAFAVRTRLSEDWALGLAVYAPWGLSTEYAPTSNARYYARATKLITINATPSLSYRLSPKLAFAAGIQTQYAKGTLSNAVDLGTLGAVSLIPGSVPGAMDGEAKLTADDWAAGYVLGLTANPTEGMTVGISYHSALHHTLSGTLDFTNDAAGIGNIVTAATGMLRDTPASAALTTPDKVSIGLRMDVSPRLTVLGELDWTNWKKFRELRVDAANIAQPDDVTASDWDASWFGAVGLEYRASETWSYRAGIAYDASPIPDQTLNPRIPDADRTTLAAGGTYRLGPSTSISFAYEHLFIADRDIGLNPTQRGNALRGVLAGTTRSSVDAVGIQWTYRLD